MPCKCSVLVGCPIEMFLLKLVHFRRHNTGRFIMFSAVTNIYKNKTKGPTLMELFTATGKLNFFLVNHCHVTSLT
jgi:hypothetical protein